MSKILIIDDDQAVRGILRQRLESLYDIADTGNPEEALAMALPLKPDCILTRSQGGLSLTREGG